MIIMFLRSKKSIVLTLTLVFLLLAAALPAFAAESSKSITANGEGIIKAKPEVASVYMSVEGQGKTAKEAKSKNAAAMNNVIKELKKLGITSEEIQAVSFNLFPIYQYASGKDQNKITGYQASSQILIKTTNIDNLGTIIDTATEAGVNNVQNVVYSVKDEEAWTLKALEKATLNAQKKAKVMAQTLGLTIKGINNVNELNSYVNTYSMDASLFKRATAAESTPLQAPQFIEIRANVSILFGI